MSFGWKPPKMYPWLLQTHSRKQCSQRKKPAWIKTRPEVGMDPCKLNLPSWVWLWADWGRFRTEWAPSLLASWALSHSLAILLQLSGEFGFTRSCLLQWRGFSFVSKTICRRGGQVNECLLECLPDCSAGVVSWFSAGQVLRAAQGAKSGQGAGLKIRIRLFCSSPQPGQLSFVTVPGQGLRRNDTFTRDSLREGRMWIMNICLLSRAVWGQSEDRVNCFIYKHPFPFLEVGKRDSCLWQLQSFTPLMPTDSL